MKTALKCLVWGILGALTLVFFQNMDLALRFALVIIGAIVYAAWVVVQQVEKARAQLLEEIRRLAREVEQLRSERLFYAFDPDTLDDFLREWKRNADADDSLPAAPASDDWPFKR